jgi:exoribonuclease R
MNPTLESKLEQIFNVKQIDQPSNDLRGILQTKDYEHFIILDDIGTQIHEFSGAKAANKCLPGDFIIWKKDHCELELASTHPPIVGTVEFTNKSKFGFTKKGVPIYLFTPYNKSYPHFVVGSTEKNTQQNYIGLVNFAEWKSTFPRGNLEKLLGPSGDYDTEMEALIHQASPYKYPKYGYEVKTTGPATNRKSITDFTFNIDPPGCKDIDDVFTIRKIDDHFIVIITISDVATYVEDGSAIDIMASLISQTLYHPSLGTVLKPMLPAEYSEQVCSLQPGKQSLGVSLQFVWREKERMITDLEWFESIVTTTRSYTYEEFQTGNFEFKEPLKDLASWLKGSETEDSHDWVAQLMIFYNKEAGKKLKKAGVGILRSHSAPDLDRLEKYRDVTVANGIIDLEMLAYSSARYCEATEQNTTHYGLNSDAYAHATSPIRRYADLVNQRILKMIIQDKPIDYIIPQSMYDMNRRQKEIKNFSRDVNFLNAISNNQREFSGIILEKQLLKTCAWKLKIYIPSWKKTISTYYKYVSENTGLSRDETREIDVTDFREVQIKCLFNSNLRNWKERVIISIE